jgi:hypothetical protein
MRVDRKKVTEYAKLASKIILEIFTVVLIKRLRGK